ncbi:hypothetical protein [Paracoccus litorisediminis]|uniref:Uncharacterized protein n=1 Tax=Paracoccus litorisediminis TaxID=2006130 RepID=A0A844HP20_9RHOB|nr:hypothetical protein [Paracoccus litorisediminis]MTH62113.1 hypothetical protein [Paracoccus litorisediminis]
MRSLAAAVVSRRAARVATHAESLVWISAKNRTTGAVESIGFWTGADHRVFSIGGQSRTYYGAGSLLEIPTIEASIGLEVRNITLGLSAISPEVEIALRGYECRFAPVQIHRAEYDDNGNLLAEPERIFKGWANSAPIVTPPIDGASRASLEVVSNARALTRYGALTKSDQFQRLRSGDRFRRYSTLTQSADIYWGQDRHRARDSTTTSRYVPTPPRHTDNSL